jgi:hydroxymethylglutaryl-CoA lyase
MSKRIELVEVGPRDGLQNEDQILSTEDKLRLIELLTEAGYKRIEVTSFVHPKWVPQMADAQTLYPKLPKYDGVTYSALVPNVRGMEAAIEAGVHEIAVFTAASETFNQKNINMGIDESFNVIESVVEMAKAESIPVRGYLSTCFGCPYEGYVDEVKVAELTKCLLGFGCFEVSVSDTIGVATPGDVDRVLKTILKSSTSDHIALHFHDTRGTAVANVLQAMTHNISVFDCAAGGAGGCPFAPGAAGNIASEDLLFMLNGMGIDTGVSLEKLKAASLFLEEALHKTLTSRVLHSPVSPLEKPFS